MLTRPNAAKHINAIGVLDIGTSKTACIIVSAPDAKSAAAGGAKACAFWASAASRRAA